ncbi:MAG TPA: hypothetical protein VF384_13310 [Planctomycetota bacterium]
MTRTTTPAQFHLLTRSDLARMEVPEGKLEQWQATGWLEEVGRLPDAENGDAVFAVHSPELRRELAPRLDATGKSAVVMAPEHVRWLLSQTRSDAKTPDAPSDGVKPARAATSEPRGSAEGPSTTALARAGWGADPAVAELIESDLPQVLHEMAIDVARELEGVSAATGSETHWNDEGLDAAAPQGFDEPYEAEGGLDAGDLEAAFSNWDPYEPASPAANDREATTRVVSQPLPREPVPLIAVSPTAKARAQTPAPARTTDAATLAMSRVETYLGELKTAVVALTKRPEPPAVDLRPLVDAVHSGFEGAARQSAAIGSTVHSLAERLKIRQQDEKSVSRAVGVAIEDAAPRSDRSPPRRIAAREDRHPIALLATAVLALCWSVLLWFKTGSANMALGAVVGASAIACCLLAARRAGA